MNHSINYHILARLSGYIRNAVCQGAFLPPEVLFQRFEKTTKLSLGGKRQRKRYIAALKDTYNSGIQFVLGHEKHGKRLYVTSKDNSHFDPNHDKEAPYAEALLKALQTTQETAVKVYETLLATTQLTKKSLEKVIQQLKIRAKQFGLIYFKKGRNLYAQLKYPYITKNHNSNRPKNTPNYGDAICRIVAKDKELRRNTPNGDFRLINQDKIRKKAFWLARRLKTHFYDNCKVKCCMPMLVKFTEDALKNGFEDKVIETKFRRALLVRHADATDMGINTLDFSFKFEMSSTVSLARRYLKEGHNNDICERWENLIENVFPEREKETAKVNLSPGPTSMPKPIPTPAPKPKPRKSSAWSQIKNIFQLGKTEDEVDDETDEAPHSAEDEDTITPKTHEEKAMRLLALNGYKDYDVQVFQQYQQRRIPMELIRRHLNNIVNMGILLAECFPERKEYDDFRKK